MRITVIGIIMATMISAAPAFGLGRAPLQGEVSIEIVSDRGSTFQSFPHMDLWRNETHVVKKYLEARKGENYGIIIRNGTPERVGVVIAVDGRNIISGKRSDLLNSEGMYIVNPYEQTRYDGWRTSDSEIHRFYFTEPSDSYSIRTFGDSSAMGVIAVAVYREKARPQPLYERNRSDSTPSAPSLNEAPQSKKKSLAEGGAGTGFGDSQYSPVVRVEFESERTPIQKTLVKYEWREMLCSKGIISCDRPPKNRLWEEDWYAPYPPGCRS